MMYKIIAFSPVRPDAAQRADPRIVYLDRKYNSATKKEQRTLRFKQDQLFDSTQVKAYSPGPYDGRVSIETLIAYKDAIEALWEFDRRYPQLNFLTTFDAYEEYFRSRVVESEHSMGDFFLKDTGQDRFNSCNDMVQLARAYLVFKQHLADGNIKEGIAAAMKTILITFLTSTSYSNWSRTQIKGPLEAFDQHHFNRLILPHTGCNDVIIEKIELRSKIDSEAHVRTRFISSINPQRRKHGLGVFSKNLKALYKMSDWTKVEFDCLDDMCSDLMYAHLWLNGNGRIAWLIAHCIRLEKGHMPCQRKSILSGFDSTLFAQIERHAALEPLQSVTPSIINREKPQKQGPINRGSTNTTTILPKKAYITNRENQYYAILTLYNHRVTLPLTWIR